MEQRVSIVTLVVKDLKASKAFYEKIGWKTAENNTEEGIAFFNLPGIVLALYPQKEAEKEVDKNFDTPNGVSSEKANPHAMTIAFNVSSEKAVDDTLAEVSLHGAKIIRPAKKAFWGGYSGYFADIDGHLWEVAYNPFSTLRKDGSFMI